MTTAVDISRFALCPSNEVNENYYDAPAVENFITIPYCPIIAEMKPGLDPSYYHDYSQCWLGPAYAVFTWTELPLHLWERLWYAYNMSRIRFTNAPTGFQYLGTWNRVWICYQSVTGRWELTTAVITMPGGMPDGTVVKNATIAVARLGFGKRTIFPGTTPMDFHERIQAGQCFDYGSSVFTPGDTANNGFIYGTGETTGA